MWTSYFEENVYPVLTPMAVDSSRPFPLIRNKSLNIAALIAEKRRARERRTGFCHGAGSLRAAPSGGASGRKGRRERGSSCLEEIIERNIEPAVPQLYDRDLRPSLPDHAECGPHASTRMRQQDLLKGDSETAEKETMGRSYPSGRSGRHGFPSLKDPEKRIPYSGRRCLHCGRSAGPDLPHENVRNGGLRPSEASLLQAPACTCDDERRRYFHPDPERGYSSSIIRI